MIPVVHYILKTKVLCRRDTELSTFKYELIGIYYRLERFIKNRIIA